LGASPKTAALEESADILALTPSSPRVAPPTTSSGEALQALLAFSALHQQIRQRRAYSDSGSSAADAWQLEHFVLDEVLQLVAERTLAITGADGVAIALADGDAIVCRALAGKVTPDAGARLDPQSGFSGACLSSGQVVRCDDSETDPRVNAEACRALGTRSMVAVPLSAKQTIVGLVEAFSSEPYGFNDCDVRSVSLLAELILAALRPEEEDRLAEISERVVTRAVVAESAPLRNERKQVEEDQTEQGQIELDQTELDQSERPEPNLFASAQPEGAQAERLNLSAKAEEEEPFAAVAAVSESATTAKSRSGLAVVAVLVAVALASGAGFWWNIRRHRAVAFTPLKTSQTRTSAASQPAAQPAVAVPPAEAADPVPEESTQEAPSEKVSGQTPEVTGIRHWSLADSSTVVIDLQDQVQYEAHRLSHPERIYVDLHDTRLVASLFNRTIDIGDALLERVRVAQPTHGVTRVVLETKGASNFSVSLEPNPYRLVIEVRTIGVEPKPRAKVELFGPMDQASPEPPLQAKNARNGSPNSALPAREPKLRIVLDAGHGGWDLGTVGRRGLLEKDLVLDIVERLGKLVEKRLAASVIYTRTDDNYIALEKRAEVANVAKADLFLSIHANYSDFPSARGVETYYTNTYSSVRARSRDDETTADVDWTNVDIREKVHESRRLAASIQHALYGTLSATNPGLPNRGVKQAQYVVLTGTSMPAVLAEVSFVSSPTDENNLQSSSCRQQIAEAIYQGLAHYTEQSRVKMAKAETPARQ
jgi:N-acetylmuramoyl-L-alanine amidase/putative methionine-R-sulfoxide reductase with GAF domain